MSVRLPSNKGQFERDFMEYSDNDTQVDAIAKISEQRHTFVRFRYIREDGLPANYVPDFFVKFSKDIYIVETKAQDQISHNNVVRKQKSAVRWAEKINALPTDKRAELTWHYVILSDSIFYDWKNKGMGTYDILNFSELRIQGEDQYAGRLF